MGDENSSGWSRVFAQLSDPLDWAAAFLGGAVGAGGTMVMHGLDVGHSIPTGALTALSLKKAGSASFRRRGLRKKAASLSKMLNSERRYPDLVSDLDDSFRKWELKIIDDNKLAAKINEICDEDTKRKKALWSTQAAAVAMPSAYDANPPGQL
jgi:hypothetical protein